MKITYFMKEGEYRYNGEWDGDFGYEFDYEIDRSDVKNALADIILDERFSFLSDKEMKTMTKATLEIFIEETNIQDYLEESYYDELKEYFYEKAMESRK